MSRSGRVDDDGDVTMGDVEAQKKFLHENPPLVTLKMKMLHLEEKPSRSSWLSARLSPCGPGLWRRSTIRPEPQAIN
ncbi:hypothetical protein E4U50_000617 [Claviceps purpurea]|nr:hypothetical protein E4U12_005140 [Claviceps purpurea]KAG6214124.1 hypothetical protein E4U50_000617 [Claviceps purpurea]